MDQLRDNSMKVWVQIGDQHEQLIPPYVLAYGLNKEASARLPDTLFVDPARRLWPVDSKEATWLSAAYFAKRAAAQELPYRRVEQQYVRDALLKAADLYGVKKDVDAILTAFEPVATKQAEDDDANYGWVMVDKVSGQVLSRRYPMFDAAGVKLAADYFADNRAKYPMSVRREISGRIMQKAAQHGIAYQDLNAAVLREAGYGIPRKDVLMDELYERAHLTKDAECAILLANINEMIAGLSDAELAQNLQKIAEVVDAFDNAAGLTRHYGVKVQMPSDFIFDIQLKQAEDALDDVIELDRYCLSLTKLACLPASLFGTVLGDEFVKSIVKQGGAVDRAKLSHQLDALSRPDRAALEDHLAAVLG